MVRNVDEAIVRELKERAARHNHSAEQAASPPPERPSAPGPPRPEQERSESDSSTGPSKVCTYFCHVPASSSSSGCFRERAQQRLAERERASVRPPHRPASLHVCRQRICVRGRHRQRMVLPRVTIGKRQLVDRLSKLVGR